METWVDVETSAKITYVVERTVHNKIKAGDFGNEGTGYRYIKGAVGRGGRKLEIALSAHSLEAQTTYHNLQGSYQKPVIQKELYTKAQRAKGERRSEAIITFKKFQREAEKMGKISKTKIKNDFVATWNLDNPDFTITTKTLYEWLSKSKSGQVEKLIDRRGGYNRGSSSIPAEYWKLFETFWLRQTKPSLSACYRNVVLEAERAGFSLPGIKAFQIAESRLPRSYVDLYREGMKFFDDNYMPYTERDYEGIYPNDIWVADHHLWDVFVRVPDGKGGWSACRPWGSYWQDIRTRKMLSSIIRVESPNSDVVLCGFGNGVREYGIPKTVLLDNGKDYKANDLFNPNGAYRTEEDFKEDTKRIVSSLAKNLLIDTIYAIPYNAKSKPIERTFRTYESQFAKLFSSYAGRNAQMRPENLKQVDILEYPTLEEFIAIHDNYVYESYNDDAHSGEGMYNASPNHMYSVLPYAKREVAPEALYFALMRIKGVRVVQRNGVQFNKEHYYADEVINHIGKEVVAKYNPLEPYILHLFDTDDNFMFTTTKVAKTTFVGALESDFELMNERKKKAKQMVLQGQTKPDKWAGSVAYASQVISKQANSFKAAVESNSTQPKVSELVRNAKLEETARRAKLDDAERNYQDALAIQQAEVEQKKAQQKNYADVFKKGILDNLPRAVGSD